ncbi:carboxylating nicotinate-nucleotide diphosphorylase [Vreelandella alkaliphila]|uniref:Probable nicotinate-nucleotide pyrophosphorylase [carboxylating] n=1 Tax=Vreelandella aquamarina TaxID=77097 RepID=A0A857GPU4_9GAMM|nr:MULTISPECIES: carboxylating nicotinate-nucleotide diphosphorylase [Halomonas]QHD51195.1 nicotinate-nucleotide diphosphorylase (carboxylating) [Halomonas meridiana]QPL45906.1 carboxylating nicotinate-nucleotide diphosphorylase [Halomonas sp. A40-4]|tara:strand:+ start:247 stop:1101 length:855 start_codon:yes stop_codon:yes gene_type:complete
MYRIDSQALGEAITRNVTEALEEDIGNGDITAQLVAPDDQGEARITAKEDATLCGVAWVGEVFRQLDPAVRIEWHVADGDRVEPGQTLCRLTGNVRSLLSGERSALNFLQMLSGTATRSRHYADLVEGTAVKLLDTRKTLPGLRLAQKYAVACGGCHSHRMGLYDAYLIKENHIAACGGIAPAIEAARRLAPGKPIEVEVETLDELRQTLEGLPDMIMLDNFSLEDMREAVSRTAGRAKLEASGGVTEATLSDIAATGVDFISLGTLTKDVAAIDLSMRLSLRQ